MSNIKRYVTDMTLRFDISDDLSITRKVQYETYAATPEDAETTARMFVTDFSRKLGEMTSNHVSQRMYDWKGVPVIDGDIKVLQTHKHHDFLGGEEDLPLVYQDD